jgi:hypothetical protein
MIFIGLTILLAIVLSLFGVAITGTTSLAAIMPIFPVFAELLVDGGAVIIPLLMVALILIIVLPIVMLVHTIVVYMRTRRGPKARFWWITILFWLASIIFWGASLVRLYQSYDMAPEILKNMVWEGSDVDEQAETIASELQLEPYHSIELRGAARLCLNNGTQLSTMLKTNQITSLVYEGGIKAEVRDSVLYLETSNQIPMDDVMIDFAITSPNVRKLTVYGASEIETAENQVLAQPDFVLDLNGAAQADLHLNVQHLTVEAEGASKLDLEGTAEQVNITIAGAGEVDAEELVTQVMHINCAGASKAEVNVTDELWAQAAGASFISYHGTPRIKQKMAVGGSIIRKH